MYEGAKTKVKLRSDLSGEFSVKVECIKGFPVITFSCNSDKCGDEECTKLREVVSNTKERLYGRFAEKIQSMKSHPPKERNKGQHQQNKFKSECKEGEYQEALYILAVSVAGE